MTAALGKLNVDIGANTQGLDKGLKSAKKSMAGFAKSASQMIASIAAGTALITAAGAAIAWPLKLAADMEVASLKFEVFLGSAEKAKTLLGELKNFAATTPFQFGEIQDATNQLLAFKTPAAEITDTLRMLGDIAAGAGAPIADLARLFGRARSSIVLTGQDINMLSDKGIPIIGELAKQFGIAESQVKKLVSTGVVEFRHLQQAIKDLTTQGGMFQGMTKVLSESVAGRFSTLKDNIIAAMTKVGQVITESLDFANLLKDLSSWIESMTPIIEGFAEVFSEYLAGGVEIAKAAISTIVVAVKLLGDMFGLSGKKIKTFKDDFVASIKSLTASAVKVFEKWKVDLVTAYTVMQVASEDWGEAFGLVIDLVVLKITELAAEVKHIFLSVMLDDFRNFVKESAKIFTNFNDSMNPERAKGRARIKQDLENLITTNSLAKVKSGDRTLGEHQKIVADFSGRPVGGSNSEIGISRRRISETEQKMRNALAKKSVGFLERINAALEKNLTKFGVNELKEIGVAWAAENTKIRIGERYTPPAAGQSLVSKILGNMGGLGIGGGEEELGGAAASGKRKSIRNPFKGLVEFQKDLQSTILRGKDPQKKQADELKRIAKINEEMLNEQKKGNKGLDVMRKILEIQRMGDVTSEFAS